MKHDSSAGVILFHQHSDVLSVLLVLHVNGNHWGFPKGHPEDEESIIQTAERELTEETGVTEYTLIPDVSFSDTYTSKSRNKPVEKKVTYFVGMTAHSDVALSENMRDEIEDVRFVPVDEAAQLLTHDSSKKILADALNDAVVISALKN